MITAALLSETSLWLGALLFLPVLLAALWQAPWVELFSDFRRQHLQRDTVGAGVIARIGPAQRDEVTGRCGGAGGGREFHAGFGVRTREEGVRGSFEIHEVRERELYGVAAICAAAVRRFGRRREVVSPATRIRADAIRHVTHQVRRGHAAQRGGVAAQSVEQQHCRA